MFTKSWLSWFWQSGLMGLLTLMGVGESAFGGVKSKTLAQSNQPPSVGTVVTVNDNVFEITGGTTVGGRNLFHSFTNFSVPSDRTASFLNDTSIVNILARVTGGNPSDIQGTIRANGTANLFLMNPYGILFGLNARLEIGGSFVATTASAIRFPGDNEFSLNSTVDSQNLLLSVNPSALLFNQIQNAAIENRSTAISGSNLVGTNIFGLRVPDGRSLLLVGGDVNLNGGTLNALGGHIEIGGLAGAGTVGLNVDGNNLRLSFPNSLARANVTLTNAAEANVVSDNGGSLTINAQNLELSGNSFLRAGIRRDSGTVNSRAGDITLDVPGSVKIANSFIQNILQNRAAGKGGNINIRSGSLSLTDGAQIAATTFGSGDAGSVLVQANEAVSLAGRNTTIFSDVQAGGVGNGGGINITAGSLSLNDGAQLLSSVNETSGSLATGRGNAGDVNINVRDAVTMNGASGTFPSGVRTNVGRDVVGNGGNINITAGSLSLTNGAQLAASTSGQGKAGAISLTARGAISFDGTAGGGLGSAALSTVNAGAVGNGGDIKITADSLSLTNGAHLTTGVRGVSSTLPGDRGNAGSVSVDVRNGLTIAGVDSDGLRSGIFSRVENGAVGNGGNISIQTGSLSLFNNGLLIANMFGQGRAGNISIQAVDAVSLRNAFISSDLGKGADGQGGNIRLSAQSISLTDGALISAATFGKGNAGSVFVQANEVVSLAGKNTTIFSSVEAGGVGNGDDINITAGSLLLNNGAQLVTGVNEASGSLAAGRGNAGNVNINVRDTVTIDGANGRFPSGVFTSIERGVFGNGGNINITAGSLSLTNDAQLSASTSGQGKAGTISLTTRGGISFGTAGGEIGGSALSTVEAGAMGDGGDIRITAESLSLFRGSQLLTIVRGSSDTVPGGRGNAGNVNVNVRNGLTIAGVDSDGFRSGIFSRTETGTVGNGGNISIQTGSLSLFDNGLLIANMFGQGRAGNISIQAVDAVSLRNAFISGDLGKGAEGQGGDIRLSAQSISLTDGAQISAATFGKGNAGSVFVQANEAVSLAGRNTTIFSDVEAGGVGNGGDINITASSLSLNNGAQLQTGVDEAFDSLAAGRGDAGNVNINVRDVVTMDGASGRFLSGVRTNVGRGVFGNGGDINITAGSLSLTNGAQLSTSIRGASGTVPGGLGNAGNVSIDVRNTITVAGASRDGLRSGIFSQVLPGAVGNGGNISIQTGSLSLFDNGLLNADMFGQGRAGNISIQAVDAVSLRNAFIGSNVGEGAEGQGGDIRLSARSVSLTDGAQISAATFGKGNAGSVFVQANEAVSLVGRNTTIFSNVEAGGVGNGGDINITASSLSLNNGAQLQTGVNEASSSLAAGRGDAGNVNINVRDAVKMDGAIGRFLSGVRTNVGRGVFGNGGDINITAGSLSLTNDAQLFASTSGQGKAGTISLTTRGGISFGTAGGEIGGSALSTVEAGAMGDGGDIRITAESLSLNNGGQLLTIVRGSSETVPGGRGNAGSVSVDVRNGLTIAGVDRDGFRSGIFSRTETGTVGNGGNISIQTGSLSLFDNGLLNANMFGQGRAGNISIQAVDAIFSRNASIFTNLGEGADGQGGDIRITANSLSLTDGAELVASSDGRGNAGNIFINVRETLQSQDSTISTAATQFTGGAIDIVAKNIRLRGNSDIRTNVSSGASGGGNITLTANSIIAFDDSDILAFARDGKGGDVIFNTPTFFGSSYKPAPKGTDPETLDNNNRVDINASGATSGIISLPDTSFIQNNLTELPENSIDTNALIASSCIARSNQQKGTFVITGSGGLPNRPGDASVSLYSTGSVRSVPNNTRSSDNSVIRQWQKGDPIVEPQGVYQLPNGKLVLSRECS